MLDLIIAIAVITIVLMGWSHMTKALNWTGSKIGSAGEIIDHSIDSGVSQMARVAIISNDSKEDTKLDSLSKSAIRATKSTEFMTGLSETEVAAVKSHSEFLSKY